MLMEWGVDLSYLTGNGWVMRDCDGSWDCGGSRRGMRILLSETTFVSVSFAVSLLCWRPNARRV